MDPELTGNDDLTFRVLIDGKTVPARITYEALDNSFDGVPDDPGRIQCYLANARFIDKIAIEKYRSNPTAPILLVDDDF